MPYFRGVRVLSLAFVVCVVGVTGQDKPAAPVKPVITVVHAGRLVDVVAGVVRPSQDFVIEGNVIKAVGSR